MYQALKSIRDPHLGEKQWDAIRVMIKHDRGLDLKELGVEPEKLFVNLTSDQYDLNFLIKIGMQKHSE